MSLPSPSAFKSTLQLPGTLGAPWMQYVVSDKVIIPSLSESKYDERHLLPSTCVAMTINKTHGLCSTLPNVPDEMRLIFPKIELCLLTLGKGKISADT